MRSLVHGTSSHPHTGQATWLLIDAPQALRVINKMQHRPSVVIARYGDLTAHLLSRVMPDWIFCQLISTEFDATDVLRKIRRTGWHGTVGVIAGPDMPDPEAVRTELQDIAPKLDIRLLTP